MKLIHQSVVISVLKTNLQQNKLKVIVIGNNKHQINEANHKEDIDDKLFEQSNRV